MAIPPYVQGYPPDGSSLGQTKATIRNNLDGTFQTVGIDHVNTGGSSPSKPVGYHTIVHGVSQVSVNTVSGYNQLFSGVPGGLTVNSTVTPSIPSNGDTQLYSLSGSGQLAQLTGYSSTSNGYCWSGGILFQWGKTGYSSSNIPVTFPVIFPNNIFNIQISVIRGAIVLSNAGNAIDAVSKSGFNILNVSPSSYLTAYYWFAIGN